MELYKEYSIEYKKGQVKNIPMQNPKRPRPTPIAATIINPKRTKGCFETITILDCMASTVFNFPKTINGIVNKVINEIVKEIMVPMKLSPKNWKRIESPTLKIETTNVAIKIFIK